MGAGMRRCDGSAGSGLAGMLRESAGMGIGGLYRYILSSLSSVQLADMVQLSGRTSGSLRQRAESRVRLTTQHGVAIQGKLRGWR